MLLRQQHFVLIFSNSKFKTGFLRSGQILREKYLDFGFSRVIQSIYFVHIKLISVNFYMLVVGGSYILRHNLISKIICKPDLNLTLFSEFSRKDFDPVKTFERI